MICRIVPYKTSSSKTHSPKKTALPFFGMAACLLLLLLFSIHSLAGTGAGSAGKDSSGIGGGKGGGGGKDDPVPPYDEISVSLNVQGVGIAQIPAAIRDEVAYLSVTDVFDFLKIRNVPSQGLDSISGFFISQQAVFLIDKARHRILYHGKVFDLKPDDMIRAESSLYLRSDYFGQIFGLDCKFNFRNLSVILTTKLELPVIREMRQELMRSNLRNLRGETKADTTIARSNHLFRLGMADWSVVSTQNPSGQGPDDTRLNLALGSVVAGGETDLALNYDNNIPFREREQYYLWHFVNNDYNGLRQVTAGKFFTPSISTMYSPVVGVQLTNAPTTFRRSFGTYPLSGYAEPEWIVELYVNNELVSYVKADASGFFTVEVPLVYGNSQVKLRYYGPWGEERDEEKLIQIPFNFLPFHQLEYTAAAGIEEDTLHSRFSRACLNYGLSTSVTVGGGLEYLSSVTSGKFIPFVNASLRAGYNLLVSGEYAYGVRTKITANYHFPSQLQFEADYTRYKKGQTAINNLFLEERKAIISYPFQSRKLSVFSRLTLYQIVLPFSSKYTTVEHLLSGVIWGVNTNITTYALFTDPAPPYVYSNLSLAFQLPGKLIFNPQLQYEYDEKKIIDMRQEVGKYLGARGYINMYYENNYKVGFQSVGIGFRYTFSFAQAGVSMTHGNQLSNTVESASGSMMYDAKTHYLGLNNRSSVGRGGIIVLPFLDLNGNGRRDKDEPKVSGLKIRLNSGSIVYNTADTIIRVSELEAYTNYIVRLDPNFDHVAWHIRNSTLSVAVDPNQFKVVEVPVTVMGEVSGKVSLKDNGDTTAEGRIMVCFYRGDSALVARTVTEADGSFDFTGLPPGVYTARIDADQLHKLHLASRPAILSFTILRKVEGDLVDGLQFTLTNSPAYP